MARRPDSTSVTRHPSQLLALAIGAVYTLIGILGFFITGFEERTAAAWCGDVFRVASRHCPPLESFARQISGLEGAVPAKPEAFTSTSRAKPPPCAAGDSLRGAFT